LSEELTRILLVRHATNDYIDAGRLAGRVPGVHLNDRGRAEAQAVAERLASAPLVAVYSSPLERAMETAGPIAELLGLPVLPVEGLVETDCGEWTGALIEDLGHTEQWGRMQVAPSCARHPGGESMAEVQARMVAVIEELRVSHAGRSVAVISHCDPIRLLVAFHSGLHVDMYRRLVVDPASITELEFGSPQPRLVRSNDRAHLEAQFVAARSSGPWR
jgi:probable phosphomutase (TIGR03848 family)